MSETDVKYYFIVYEWTRDGMSSWEKSNMVTTEHPVIWLHKMISALKDRYRILFWKEIDKEHFELIDGWVD